MALVTMLPLPSELVSVSVVNAVDVTGSEVTGVEDSSPLLVAGVESGASEDGVLDWGASVLDEGSSFGDELG
jgi:hypothetical protein